MEGCDYKGRASRAVREGQAKDPGHRNILGRTQGKTIEEQIQKSKYSTSHATKRSSWDEK